LWNELYALQFLQNRAKNSEVILPVANCANPIMSFAFSETFIPQIQTGELLFHQSLHFPRTLFSVAPKVHSFQSQENYTTHGKPPFLPMFNYDWQFLLLRRISPCNVCIYRFPFYEFLKQDKRIITN
jgi:hypothetical protein